jgi:hypothetical protein
LYALKRVPGVRIPPSPPDFNLFIFNSLRQMFALGVYRPLAAKSNVLDVEVLSEIQASVKFRSSQRNTEVLDDGRRRWGFSTSKPPSTVVVFTSE